MNEHSFLITRKIKKLSRKNIFRYQGEGCGKYHSISKIYLETPWNDHLWMKWGHLEKCIMNYHS
jgi:hypothetical protein